VFGGNIGRDDDSCGRSRSLISYDQDSPSAAKLSHVMPSKVSCQTDEGGVNEATRSERAKHAR
jgi:hypothetical protein